MTVIRVNKLIQRKCFPIFSIEVGLVLIGSEIPCIRKSLFNCNSAFAKINGKCIFMHGLLFNCSCHKERQTSLLITRREFDKVKRYIKSKGNGCFVEDLHFKNNLIKAKITIGKGKKEYSIIKSRSRQRGGELEVDSVSLR